MKQHVIRGGLWVLAEVGGGEIINLAAFVVLSRLLNPSDYGLASLAGVIAMFPQILLTRGLTDVIVARQEMDEDVASTIFWTNLILAATLFGFLQSTAGTVAWCFGKPLIAPLLRWLGLCFFTSALTAVPLAVLRRNLRFEAFAARAAGGSAVGGTAGIVMALAGCGVWSLVGLQLTQGLVALAAVWVMGSWRPKFRFSLTVLRDIAPFSVHTALGATLDLLGSRVDTVAVGLFLDAPSLGYYSLLKRVLQTAAAVAIYPVWAVSMPALRRLAGDWPAFTRAYTSLIGAAQACWVPVIAGLSVSASDVLPAVFGVHWTPAVPLFQAAFPMMLPCAITFCSSQVLAAVGRPGSYTVLALLQLGITAVIVGATAPFGAAPASFGLAISSLIALPFHLVVLRRSAGSAVMAALWRSVQIAGAGAFMAIGILLIRIIVLDGFPAISPVGLSCLDVGSGVLLYVSALRLFAPSSFAELVTLGGIMTRRLRRRPPGDPISDFDKEAARS
jgi:O-antigen/teichoic acid export membrane protein